jgi:hypothetical protein
VQGEGTVAGFQLAGAAAGGIGAAVAQFTGTVDAFDGASGMRLSKVLTTPPMALPPYSRAAGPRTISMRSTVTGSSGTAWS